MKHLSFLFLFTLLVCISLRAQFTGTGGVMGASGNFAQYLNKTLIKPGGSNKSAVINSFNDVENTKGTRFLFNTWVKGDSILDVKGNLIATTSFLFNYDKMTGNLLATEDKINNMSVAPAGIRSFILKDNNRNYIFQHVDAIEPNRFYLTLVKSDTGYCLYKQLAVSFKKADFRNDGVVQTGSTEDEYKDESQFYLVQPAKGSSKQIELKPKSIKALLESEKEKTDAFFKQHKNDELDERFLINLVTYLNQ